MLIPQTPPLIHALAQQSGQDDRNEELKKRDADESCLDHNIVDDLEPMLRL